MSEGDSDTFTIVVNKYTTDDEVLKMVENKRQRISEETKQAGERFEQQQTQLLKPYEESRFVSLSQIAREIYTRVVPIVQKHIQKIKEVDLDIQQHLACYTPAEQQYIQEFTGYWPGTRECETDVVVVCRRLVQGALRNLSFTPDTAHTP